MAIFDHRLMQIGNTQTFVLFKIKYRNASIKRPGAYSISKLWGGCLFEWDAYITATILQAMNIVILVHGNIYRQFLSRR